MKNLASHLNEFLTVSCEKETIGAADCMLCRRKLWFYLIHLNPKQTQAFLNPNCTNVS